MVKLSLGTAQLGMDYGISNEAGRPDGDTARQLLLRAVDAGLDSIDTAPAYGESERTIGQLLPTAGNIRLMTKTLPGSDVPGVVDRFHRSLANLGVESVDALLVHDCAALTDPHSTGFAESLVGLRDEGLVKKLGVSVYDPGDIESARALLPIEVVQLPLNALDQRFLVGGTISALAAGGIEVHVRSIFLQGLLLLEPDRLPPSLAVATPALAAFRDACVREGVSNLEGALGFAAGIDELQSVVVGVNSVPELDECILAARRLPAIDYERLAIDDRAVIDPRGWHTG